MANTKTLLDEWSVKDLEDGSSITISVYSCTELGNQSKPGLQVWYFGTVINYEPLAVEKLAYQASKAGVQEYLLESNSWMVHEDQFIKNYLVTGDTLKAKVEVKTRSSKPVTKEYELPFKIA